MTPDDVPPGPLVLDTNVASHLYLKKSGSRWQDFETLVAGHVLCVSFATVGEMLVMAHRAQWGERRKADLIAHVRRYTVLKFDFRVCQSWAAMSAKLQGHLKAGGANDMWTAACALTKTPSLPVVTSDLSDFEKISAVSGLVLIHPDL